MRKINVILSTLLLTISTTAIATTTVDSNSKSKAKISGFYIGAGYGTFFYNTNNDWNNSSKYGNLIENTEGGTLKIYGGYQFNKVVGIEVTYSDYGNTEGSVNFPIPKEVKQSPSSLSLAANLGYTMSSGVRPFGLLGLSSMSLNSSNEFLDTDNPIAFKAGIGVEYAPIQLRGLQLRIAYEADFYLVQAYTSSATDLEVSTFSLSSLYAGVSYKF